MLVPYKQEYIDGGIIKKFYNKTTNTNNLRGETVFRSIRLKGYGGKRLDILNENVDIYIYGTYDTGYVSPWVISNEQIKYSTMCDEMRSCVIKNVDGKVDLAWFRNNTNIVYFEFNSAKAILEGNLNYLANSYNTIYSIWIG